MEEIELIENDGNAKILVDGKHLKCVTGYQIKRSVDNSNAIINLELSIPRENFKTNLWNE